MPAFERIGFAPNLVGYDEGYRKQLEVHAEVVSGKRPDTVLLLEHNSVYTAGKRTELGELPDEVDSQPVHTVTPDDIDVGLWSCVHPCALLVLTVGDRAIEDQMRREFIKTLDNYGWLTEKGSPDYRRAMREYELNTKEN